MSAKCERQPSIGAPEIRSPGRPRMLIHAAGDGRVPVAVLVYTRRREEKAPEQEEGSPPPTSAGRRRLRSSFRSFVSSSCCALSFVIPSRAHIFSSFFFFSFSVPIQSVLSVSLLDPGVWGDADSHIDAHRTGQGGRRDVCPRWPWSGGGRCAPPSWLCDTRTAQRGRRPPHTRGRGTKASESATAVLPFRGLPAAFQESC